MNVGKVRAALLKAPKVYARVCLAGHEYCYVTVGKREAMRLLVGYSSYDEAHAWVRDDGVVFFGRR